MYKLVKRTYKISINKAKYRAYDIFMCKCELRRGIRVCTSVPRLEQLKLEILAI